MLDSRELRSDIMWRDIRNHQMRCLLAEMMYNELLLVDRDAFYLTIAWHNGSDIEAK